MRRSGVQIPEAAPWFLLVFSGCANIVYAHVRAESCVGCMKELESFLLIMEQFVPVQPSNKVWVTVSRAVNVSSITSQGSVNVCCFS